MKYFVFVVAIVGIIMTAGCAGDEPQPAESNPATLINPRDTSRVAVIPRGPADSIYYFRDYFDDALQCGFKNRAGEVIIKPKFEIAGNFDGAMAPVIYKGKHGFCDTSGNISYRLKDLEFAVAYNGMDGVPFFHGQGEDLFMVVNKKGKYGYVNNHAELVIPCQFEAAERFSEGKAIIYKNGKAGFINTAGEIVIQPAFEDAYSFSEDRAAVIIDGKTGFIDPTGELVIPANYYYAYRFSEGLAVVTKSQDYTDFFYMDKAGKTAIAGPFEAADSFENGEALVQKRGKCKIIDKTGTVIRSGGETCFEGC